MTRLLKILKLYGFILLLFYSVSLTAQNDNLRIETKAGAYLSTSGKTPFLNKTNQYGLVPVQSNVAFLNASLYQPYDSSYSNNKLQKTGFSYGLEVQGNFSKNTKILLPQAFASLRLGGFELYAGRKKEMLGLADTTGTFRSYIWSGNAMPMPKIQISTPNFVPILGHDFLSANLGYSHGWFGNQKYTEGYYLHQKWLYLKIGNDHNLINLLAGINNEVQWGGYSETLKDNDRASVNGYFPEDLYVYLNVAIPIGGIFKKPPGKIYSYYETGNRFGNHLGTIDLGIKLNLDNSTISFYRQTPWEDGQAPEVFLSADGNYTLIIEPIGLSALKKISFEFLNTQKQGYERSNFAKWIGWPEKHPGEYQNYLNHGQYLEGWSYNGYGLGAPAILPNDDLTIEAQSQNFTRFSRDNMVLAPAVSVMGKIDKVEYNFSSSYIVSKGLLTSQRNEPLSQFSTQLAAKMPINDNGLYISGELGFDIGKLYGTQTGLNLTISKIWHE